MIEKTKKLKNGLTLKLVSVILPLTAIFIALLLMGFYTVYVLKGDAPSINYAGQLRYRSYQLAGMLNEYPNLEGAARAEARVAIQKKIAEFEEILYGLRDGNQALGLKGFKLPQDAEEGSFSYQDPWWQFDRHNSYYSEHLKPLMLNLLETPSNGEARETLRQYNKEVPLFVNDIDRTVQLLSSLPGIDAPSINYAGQLRYRSYQLAMYVNEYPNLSGGQEIRPLVP